MPVLIPAKAFIIFSPKIAPRSISLYWNFLM